MEENKIDVVEKVETPTTEVKVEKKVEPSQRTEKEKAEYSLRKNAERLKELGGDPISLLGVKLPEDADEEDNAPLTIAKLKEFQKKTGQQTALQMADAIEDEIEREEVKNLLTSRIMPSGNAEADLLLARGAVNSKRHAKLAEEANRKSQPIRTASGGTQPGKVEEQFTPTAEELIFMRPPYNLSKAKIIENRQKALEASK